MKKTVYIIIVISLLFLIGRVTKYYWLPNSVSSKYEAESARKVLYWVAPMDPNYRRDKPGKSPMGMDLVPVYENAGSEERGIVKISSGVENNLGVKTEKVKRMDLSRIIDTVGYVTVDENNIEHIHTYTDGWVRKQYVKTTGELVEKGQLLLELYSPTLNNAQDELVLALSSNNAALIRAGEKKLLTLGMSQTQIDQLKKSRRSLELVKIYATQGGVVSTLNVREGKFVKPATDLMTIEDLSTIWMIAEVFERQSGWVKEGQQAIAMLPYVPGKVWQGVIDYVYPELDPKTHTLRVRLTFPNPDLTIKPNMYANIKILSERLKNVIAVPRFAVIPSETGDRVILSLGNGRYKAQLVKLGIESGEYYQIIDGLTQNDTVVISSQFLIDSESNISAAIERMESTLPMKSDKTEIDKMPREYVGMGTIKTVDDSMRTIILDHEPMPALNMPAMTMELHVQREVNLRKVKAGDHVHFILIKDPNRKYIVTKISVMNKDKSKTD